MSTRRVCEALGLAFSPQRSKLEWKPWACVTMIVTHDASGRRQEMHCLHLDALPMWLVAARRSRSHHEAMKQAIVGLALVLGALGCDGPSDPPSDAGDAGAPPMIDAGPCASDAIGDCARAACVDCCGDSVSASCEHQSPGHPWCTTCGREESIGCRLERGCPL